MIETQQITAIDSDSLKEWLDKKLLPHFPAGTEIAIMPHTWEAKGESRFFCEIDVNQGITLTELMTRVVSEHSRNNYIYFYAEDVVAAAVQYKELVGNYFWLYYKW